MDFTLLRKGKAFIATYKATTKKVKQMISKELELDETNPVKHMVMLTLVSEFTLVHFDSPRQKINERDSKVKLKTNKK